MPWPTDDLDTTEFEAASRSPAAARPMLLRLIQRVQGIIGARDQSEGIAPLGVNRTVPTANLPAATQAALGITRISNEQEITAGAGEYPLTLSQTEALLARRLYAPPMIGFSGGRSGQKLLLQNQIGGGFGWGTLDPADPAVVHLAHGFDYSVLARVQASVGEATYTFSCRSVSGRTLFSESTHYYVSGGHTGSYSGPVFYCQFKLSSGPAEIVHADSHKVYFTYTGSGNHCLEIHAFPRPILSVFAAS